MRDTHNAENINRHLVIFKAENKILKFESRKGCTYTVEIKLKAN